MINNFLLSNASVLALTVIVLNFLIIPAWSMEDKKGQDSHSAITVKNSNKADENENPSSSSTMLAMKSRNEKKGNTGGENENNNSNGNINSTQQSSARRYFVRLLEYKDSILNDVKEELNLLFTYPWSMGNEEDQNSNVPLNPNYFRLLPLEIKVLILKMAAVDLGKAKENKFCMGKYYSIGNLSNLALVCKDWNENIIQNKNPKLTPIPKDTIKEAFWRGHYNITDPKHIETFGRFYKGKLIYRPAVETDEKMIIFPISDLNNPLESQFDVSRCVDLSKYGIFITGYPNTRGGDRRLMICVMPWFLADKMRMQMHQNSYTERAIENWNAESAPIGIFWAEGGMEDGDISDCAYLVSESIDMLGSKNLLEMLKKAEDRRWNNATNWFLKYFTFHF